jgi:hypothetical protein
MSLSTKPYLPVAKMLGRQAEPLDARVRRG